MKYLKYLVLSLILVSIVLSGCTGTRQEPGVSAPYYGGSEGLVAEFEDIGSLVSQSGYPEVWEDQGIPILIRVYNRGEFIIPSGEAQFVIKGIKIPEDFDSVQPLMTNTKEIEKVSEYLPEGGDDVIDFGEAYYRKGVTGTMYDANIFVEYTYPYEQTVLIPKVCFKGDPYDDTICQVDEAKQAFISGGPIQIGTVIQRPAGKGRISIEIPLRNVGGGKAKADDGFNDFSPLYDEVMMEVPDVWECTAKGSGNMIRITRNGETVVRCKYGFYGAPIPETDVYTSAFDLRLSYVYQDFVSQTVRIRENPELH